MSSLSSKKGRGRPRKDTLLGSEPRVPDLQGPGDLQGVDLLTSVDLTDLTEDEAEDGAGRVGSGDKKILSKILPKPGGIKNTPTSSKKGDKM